MRPSTKRALVLGVLALTAAAAAAARPGGGDSYSGSGSSSGPSGSSDGGGGGGGDSGIEGLVLELLFRLCIEHPRVGIPLTVTVVGGYLVVRNMDSVGKAWSSSRFGGGRALEQAMQDAAAELEHARAHTKDQHQLRAEVEGIRALDPEFSVVLFEDFLYALYSEVHTARGQGRLAALTPYVSVAAQDVYDTESGNAVDTVIVGSLRYLDVRGVRDESPRVSLIVRFEANYTEHDDGDSITYYVVEEWVLSRAKTARSRPPKRTRVFDCPNCGAPLEKVVGTVCEYCKQVVSTGSFDWVVDGVEVTRLEQRPPAITGGVEEQGTERPTVVDAQARSRLDAISERDPATTWEALSGRARLIFSELQLAWSAQELLRARAYLSDRQYETMQYLLETYRRQGLRNVTENARVTDLKLARVVSDKHYDAVTLRVFANGLDYTLNAAGRVVGGSKTEERPYTEYWTLIRGALVTGAPRTEPVCPSCGAPVDINMTGHCNHCRAEVTSGEFDWVLSRIEQDDSY